MKKNYIIALSLVALILFLLFGAPLLSISLQLIAKTARDDVYAGERFILIYSVACIIVIGAIFKIFS